MKCFGQNKKCFLVSLSSIVPLEVIILKFYWWLKNKNAISDNNFCNGIIFICINQHKKILKSKMLENIYSGLHHIINTKVLYHNVHLGSKNHNLFDWESVSKFGFSVSN